MNPDGRPAKYLDPEQREKLVQAIRDGNYAVTACKLAGIHESTYYKWLEKAEKPDAPPELIELIESISIAEAEAEADRVAKVIASQRPADHLEFLARRYPKRWSKTERHEVEATTQVRVYVPNPGRRRTPDEGVDS